jgi:predicted O-methyltransferase YrrM
MHVPVRMMMDYLRFLARARSLRGYGIHSPFVYKLVTEVIGKAKFREIPALLVALRKELLNDQRLLSMTDRGAGPKSGITGGRTVREIVKQTSINPKKGRLLMQLVTSLDCHYILEMGAGTGISTAFLSMANPDARVISLEGSSVLAALARENMQKLGIHNAEVREGWFDELLPEVLASSHPVDLAFLDGNHRMAPTLDYVNQLKRRASEKALIIIDDIYWSREMKQAWRKLEQDPEIPLTIDLFSIGMVFPKMAMAKQKFVIRY